MFQDLKPYPEYKDADLPWLETLPSHWAATRGKTLFTRMERPVREGDGVVTCFRDGRVMLRSRRRTTGFTESLKEIGYQGIRQGDLVIHAMDAFAGAVGVAEDDGKSTPVYAACVPRGNVSARYYAHLVRRLALSGWIQANARGVRERSTDYRWASFAEERLPVPPREEQEAIVTYLAHAHQRINEAISAKKRMIGLLKEQKLTFVNEAMTRGVADSPALGDSGDVFLGMMPEHWQDLTVSRVIDFVTSGSRGWAEYYSDEGALFLQSGNLGRNLELNLARIQRVSPPGDSEGTRTQVQKGDVLVCITGALTGNVAVVDRDLGQDAYVNQHVALVRPKEAFVYPRFLGLTLWCATGQVQFKAAEYGGTKQGLGLTDVKGVRIGLPPLDEQRAIVTAVDRLSDQIDRQVSVVSREIALLEEFRTRLTADVTTGQVDVRSIAATLPPIDLADVFDASAGAVGAEDGETADEADVEDE